MTGLVYFLLCAVLGGLALFLLSIAALVILTSFEMLNTRRPPAKPAVQSLDWDFLGAYAASKLPAAKSPRKRKRRKSLK